MTLTAERGGEEESTSTFLKMPIYDLSLLNRLTSQTFKVLLKISLPSLLKLMSKTTKVVLTLQTEKRK